MVLKFILSLELQNHRELKKKDLLSHVHRIVYKEKDDPVETCRYDRLCIGFKHLGDKVLYFTKSPKEKHEGFVLVKEDNFGIMNHFKEIFIRKFVVLNNYLPKNRVSFFLVWGHFLLFIYSLVIYFRII